MAKSADEQESDLERQVAEPWHLIDELDKQSSTERHSQGKWPLSNVDVARKIDGNDRTVSRWGRRKSYVPALEPFRGIAVAFGGDPAEAERLWRDA